MPRPLPSTIVRILRFPRLASSDAAALPNRKFGSSPVTEMMAQEMARLGGGPAAGMDLWELLCSWNSSMLFGTAPTAHPALRFGRLPAATSLQSPRLGSPPPSLALPATKSPLGQWPAVPPTLEWVLERWSKHRQPRAGLPAATSSRRQRSVPALVTSNDRAG